MLKQRHELAVAERLVVFLRRLDETVGNPRAGDIRQGEPDAVCSVPQGQVGIEVACGYYGSEDARDAWSIARGRPEGSRHLVEAGEDAREAVQQVPVLRDPDAALATELNRILIDHCARTYGVPTYLVLDAYGPSHAPLTTNRDAPSILARFTRPALCSFVRIYLCLSDSATGEPVFIAVD